MLDKNFQDFINTYGNDIIKNITSKIEKDFSGQLTHEELIARLISETNTTAISYLAHYHSWLVSKYNLIPKD